jgi:hypothetical protein
LAEGRLDVQVRFRRRRQSVAAPSAAAPGLPQLQTDRPLRWAIWAAKLVLYVGLFGGIDGAFYAAWIATEPRSSRTGKCVAAAVDCGLVAAVISVGLHGARPTYELRPDRQLEHCQGLV